MDKILSFLENLKPVDPQNYFDNASTSKPYSETIEISNKINQLFWANPNNLHSDGMISRKILDKARKIIADTINADPSEIYFTSSASEGNSLIIENFDVCVCSKYEHHDIHDHRKSYIIKDFDDKNISSVTQTLKESHHTAVFAHMMVNNETGQIFSVDSGTDKIHSLGYPILVDATQAIGNIPIDVKEIGCDFLTFSCHKCHGLKVGVLYISNNYKDIKNLHSIINGTQEKNLRGGTQNVADIYASAYSVKRSDDEACEKYLHTIKLRELFLKTIYDFGVDYQVNEGPENIPSILNVSFSGISGDSLMLVLDDAGFTVSTGSACNSGNLDPSYVLKSMDVDPKYLKSAIRISFSLDNTEKSVLNLAKEIISITQGVQE